MVKISSVTLKYGSSGNEVKKLQQELNKHGYKLAVDGQFGSKTQAAVRDYQKNNGLAVDGIVGKNTMGKLYGGGSSSDSSSSSETKETKATKTFSSTPRPEYEKSAEVQIAEKKLSNWEKSAPEDYNSKYSEEIEKLLSDVLNRGDFSYNLNADPLYEQYRENYTQNGKKAMEDAIGNASALTGGYLNSYAVTAGQEAYGEYLSGLNDVALNLRDRAFDEYVYEGESLLEDVTLLRSLDGDDYDKYLNSLERYYKDGEYLLDRLTSMSDAEYEQFLQSVDAWEDDRNHSFAVYKDSLDREQFEKELNFKKSEAERDQKNKDRAYALSASKSSSSGSSKSSSGKNAQYGIYPKTYSDFVSQTGISGVLTESEFANREDQKEKYGSYEEYLEKMYKKYA